jgi:MOSC domain-containing protein YiiM
MRESLIIRERAITARAVVAKEGLTVKTLASGVVHVNPALAVAERAEKQWAALWSKLARISHTSLKRERRKALPRRELLPFLRLRVRLV